jgi:hypothetical protein
MDVKRKVVIAGATALVLTAGASAATAAVMSSGPVDSSGAIHGCWTTKAGHNGSHVFRLQDAGASCPDGTTAISWNMQGPAGPQGPPGVVGEVSRQNSVSFPVGLTPPGIESVTVSCPQGYVATGGGFALSGPQGIGGNATEKWIPVFGDATTSNGVPSGWEVGLAETGTAGNAGGNYVLNAYVYCAPTS